MIVRQEIDGRPASIAYLTTSFEPAGEDDAGLVHVMFDDGQSLWLTPTDPPAQDAGPWEESKHPRGQPGNKGEFASAPGGGGAAPSKAPPEPKGAPPAAKGPSGGGEAPRPSSAPAAAPAGGAHPAAAEAVAHLFKPEAVEHLPKAATQPFKSWEEASAMAPAAQSELDGILENVAKKLGARRDFVKPDELAESPEDLNGPDNFVFRADIKREARSKEKVGEGPSAEHPEGVGDYRGHWDQLRDMVRGTITVGSLNDLGHAVQALEDEGLVLSQQPKNRFNNNPTPEGYRDLNLVMKLPKSPLHVELQLNLKKMVAAKEAGHKFYEVQRTLQGPKGYSEQEPTERWTPEDRDTFFKMRAAQKAIYEPAWEDVLKSEAQPHG